MGKLLVAQLGLRGVKTQLMQLAPCIRLQEQAGLEGGEGGKEELKARVLSRHRWPALLPLTPSPPLMPLVRCACSSVITMMRQHVRVQARGGARGRDDLVMCFAFQTHHQRRLHPTLPPHPRP